MECSLSVTCANLIKSGCGGGAIARGTASGQWDIQSLADLSNSFDVVLSMRVCTITNRRSSQLVAATLAPVVPLALTMMHGWRGTAETPAWALCSEERAMPYWSNQ